jgi:hypothetical protein
MQAKSGPLALAFGCFFYHKMLRIDLNKPKTQKAPPTGELFLDLLS